MASDALKAAAKDQPMVGGYAEGEPLRAKDTEAIDEMWEKARAYVVKHYSGYDVDLAPLIPARAEEPTRPLASLRQSYAENAWSFRCH